MAKLSPPEIALLADSIIALDPIFAQGITIAADRYSDAVQQVARAAYRMTDTPKEPCDYDAAHRNVIIAVDALSTIATMTAQLLAEADKVKELLAKATKE